jgi:hypothetical protein
VELEVYEVAYCIPEEPGDLPIVIFSVMINRPCAWLPNSSGHYFEHSIIANPPPEQVKPGMEKLVLSSTPPASHGTSQHIKSFWEPFVPAILTQQTSKNSSMCSISYFNHLLNFPGPAVMICKRNGQRFLRMQQCDFYFFICSVHPCL